MLIYSGVFLCVLAVMPFTVKFAWRVGAIDVPRDWRRMHRTSIPRNGGMAIGIAFLVGCAALNATRDVTVAYWIVGGLLVLVAGLADDIRPLPPLVKLLIQMLAAMLVAAQRSDLSAQGRALAVLWVVTLTNAHNFIDGLDGLLCGVSALEAISLGILLWSARNRLHAQVAWCLAAACLGFRVFNRHPARIFAGDCGSGSVGFWMGALSLQLLPIGESGGFLLAPFLLFVYPLADLFAAVLRRLLRGKSPFCADRGHLHHRICDAGLSRKSTVHVLMLLSGGFCGIAVLIDAYRFYAGASLCCMALAFLLILLRGRIVKKASLQRSH